MNEDQLNDQLKQAQAKHLRALERWAIQQPKVAGVPIIQALTYDLIQVTNQMYLRKVLEETNLPEVIPSE